VAWLVWSVAGVLVLALATSWWFDRDARRRGANPRSAAGMASSARSHRWETVRRESQMVQGGATPGTADAHAATWKGKQEPR